MINESFKRVPKDSTFPKCAIPDPFLSLRAQDEGHPFIEPLGMVINGRHALLFVGRAGDGVQSASN